MNKEIESFKRKTIKLLLFQCIAIGVGMALIIFLVMFPKITELENKYLDDHLQRVDASFNEKIQVLEKIAFDWAVWDDSYTFMSNSNQEYIDSNISYATFENLNVNIMLFIDENNQLVFGKISDQAQGTLYNIQDNLIEEMKKYHELMGKEAVHGVIGYNNHPLLFVKHPVTNSDGSGEFIGSLVFMTYINDVMVNQMSNDLNIELSYELINPLEFDRNQVNSIVNKDVIEGFYVIDNSNNEPLMLMSLEMPRSIRDIGEQGMKNVLLGVLFIYLIFTLSIYLFFDKTVLKKLYGFKDKLSNSEEKLANLNETLEATVIERTRRLNAIVKAIPDVIFKLDKHGNFVDSEISDVEWLLADENEFIGKNLKDIMPPHIAQKGLELLKEAIDTGIMTIQEYDLEFEGIKTYFEVRFISNGNEEVFAILRNVTELNEKTRYIEYLSYHDQLTKIHNRRYYEEKVKLLNIKENLPLSIAMIDINGLKLINDIFGHVNGDILISKVAEVLQRHTEGNELLARIGGDEFILLLPKTNHDEALDKINDIQISISNESIKEITMSISIGLETKVQENESLSELLIAAENKMYRKKLIESQRMRKSTVESILNNLYEDNDTEKVHSLQVRDYCLLLGKELEYSDNELDELEKSALLHDIGKISIDDDILELKRNLYMAEYDQVKKHAENGYQLLKSVDSYASIAENVLSHHEHWDGKGYPRQIKADHIPQISRIISIADAYEAMVNERPYKEKYSEEQAKKELITCSGSQFDPELVNIFVNKCI